ncbi:MAG TPA: LuxR C-terminal-related transcriptional regulator [Euzebyales bacterium]
MQPDRPMLAGKLAPSWTRPTAVPRLRLLARLDEPAPLAVVVAPAGWGKTTLLVQWARADDDRPPVAWVTLDDSDDDPVRFWAYVVTAMQHRGVDVGAEALAALRVPGLDPLDLAVPSLINDLAAAGPCALVLDDYHSVTDRRIHEAVEFLITYLPTGSRVVIAARFDPPLPLARLRARGQLTELRVGDLRLKPAEAADVVDDVARVRLPAQEVGALVDRTEGWAAGVHLAALTLRSAFDPLVRIAEIAGDDRHIADYFATEVLVRLPEDHRDFLLRSSVLDRMCGELCDAALQRTGSAALLDDLERAGLFVVALDEHRQWYRYHRLFRDALRREADAAADDAEALRAAAAWFDARGDVETAIRYLTAAGCQREAAERLIASDDDFLDAGAAGTFLRLADDLDTELVRADTRLAIAMASAAGFSGQFERVDALLDLAERSLTDDVIPPPGWTTAAAAIDTLRGSFGRRLDPSATIGVARRAVALEGDPTRHGYAISRLTLGIALAGIEAYDEAVPLLDEAWRRATALELPVFTRLITAGALAMALLDATRDADAQAVLDASATAADALEAALGAVAGAAIALLRAAQGRVLYEQGRIADAAAVLERAARLARAAAFPSQTARVLVVLADALVAAGDRAAARDAVNEAREIADNDPLLPATVRRITAAEERLGRGAARIASAQGAVPEALTDRELSVLRALQGPLTQREIGNELYLSRNTVKGYTKSLYRKLQVTSRSDAVRRGRDLGLI